jgi:hypothetical protein
MRLYKWLVSLCRFRSMTGVGVDRRYWWIGTLAASALVAGGPGPAHARSDTVAYWEMDDRGRTMYDHSGNNLDGRIGREVGTGGGSFRFGRLQPDTPPVHPEHLVTVPDRAALDPGDNDFSITLRLRAHEQFGNIIQKGQATVPGGSYKLQFPSGQPECWFRGARGQVLVRSPRAVNDRRWHVIQCVRTSAGVALSVDGRTVAGRRGATGRIDNTWPLSIGGKTSCDQVHVGCDYFAGDLDYVKIASARAGAYARSLPSDAPAAHAPEPQDGPDDDDWGNGWDDGWDDWPGDGW